MQRLNKSEEGNMFEHGQRNICVIYGKFGKWDNTVRLISMYVIIEDSCEEIDPSDLFDYEDT